MKIFHTITFTGIDNHTSVNQLAEVENMFPNLHIEWGVLISETKAGQGRFPSIEKITEFNQSGKELSLSAHICGSLTRNICLGDWSGLKKYDFSNFLRMQINFSHDQKTKEFFDSLNNVENLPRLIAQVRDFNDPVIWGEYPFHALLDRSGGRGILNENWEKAPKLLSGNFIGYAGGLNADNIQSELTKIYDAAGDCPFWIDMESGVRTDDVFDLSKVISVLNKINEWKLSNGRKIHNNWLYMRK